ncbi:MAG: glycosyltransferase family 2 protein [Pseudomonadota bacterium]
MLTQITPIIICFNEQENIARSLQALSWAREVLVVDSFSTDDTIHICAQFPNVRLIQHVFTSFADQCNFALTQDIESEWVLSMDADYVVTKALLQELAVLDPPATTKAYRIGFDYLVNGKKLRGSLYPPRTALYRKANASYQQDGHAHRVVIDGSVDSLQSRMEHDDRKPWSRWLASQRNYAAKEAEKLSQAAWSSLSLADKLRKLGIAPLIVVPYTLLLKGLILDGKAGLEYCKQRLIAEVYLQRARLKKL